ncbi:MAG: 50S ribosomal protein L10 [Clostridiaceae bacterium]|nr:50S ribosomal protein L10 [Clostridiaceae bacterium]
MPNAKVLEEKRALVAELTEKMKNASAGVLVDYKGITVADDTKLRRELRTADVEYAVIKNTMLRFAINELGLTDLDAQMNGTTALAISPTDPVAAAKILTAYAKKNDKFKVKGGFVDGKALTAAEVGDLAQLPPRDVLIAKVLGGFNAPISGLVGVTSGLLRGVVAALAAIAEKKAEPAA